MGSFLSSRAPRLAFFGGVMLGGIAALCAIPVAWERSAEAAANNHRLSARVLEGVLLDHMETGEADRALRYLAQFHHEESVRQWASAELAADLRVASSALAHWRTDSSWWNWAR